MRKKIIEGIKPFNEFFYRSCYYHQLLSGLSCFGIEKDNLLLNSFLQIEADFQIETKELFSEKEIERSMGYKTTRCNISKNRLIKNIIKNRPIIVGVDCYYLEYRKDTYNSKHMPHFILVYGYDLDNDAVNVVEHDYANDYIYKEKAISLSGLLLANRMLNKGEFQRRYTCTVLEKTDNDNEFFLLEFIRLEDLERNRIAALKNTETLRSYFISDHQKIKEQNDIISHYLQEVKQYFFALSKTKIFSGFDDRQEVIERLISCYSNILSLIWKMDAHHCYDFINNNLDKILRKLDGVVAYERTVYNVLMGEKHGKILPNKFKSIF